MLMVKNAAMMMREQILRTVTLLDRNKNVKNNGSLKKFLSGLDKIVNNFVV